MPVSAAARIHGRPPLDASTASNRRRASAPRPTSRAAAARRSRTSARIDRWPRARARRSRRASSAPAALPAATRPRRKVRPQDVAAQRHRGPTGAPGRGLRGDQVLVGARDGAGGRGRGGEPERLRALGQRSHGGERSGRPQGLALAARQVARAAERIGEVHAAQRLATEQAGGLVLVGERLQPPDALAQPPRVDVAPSEVVAGLPLEVGEAPRAEVVDGSLEARDGGVDVARLEQRNATVEACDAGEVDVPEAVEHLRGALVGGEGVVQVAEETLRIAAVDLEARRQVRRRLSDEPAREAPREGESLRHLPRRRERVDSRDTDGERLVEEARSAERLLRLGVGRQRLVDAARPVDRTALEHAQPRAGRRIMSTRGGGLQRDERGAGRGRVDEDGRREPAPDLVPRAGRVEDRAGTRRPGPGRSPEQGRQPAGHEDRGHASRRGTAGGCGPCAGSGGGPRGPSG